MWFWRRKRERGGARGLVFFFIMHLQLLLQEMRADTKLHRTQNVNRWALGERERACNSTWPDTWKKDNLDTRTAGDSDDSDTDYVTPRDP